MDDWLDLLTMQLDVARAVGFVASPQAGGIDIFLGTTRAEANAQGHQLLSLDYEAYDAMARKQLRALADSARQQWPILRLALLHRLGQVQVGEASVLIAVSTPHRAEAFEACRWLIDQLKKDVTLWKKEIWANGEATWIHPAKAVTFFSNATHSGAMSPVGFFDLRPCSTIDGMPVVGFPDSAVRAPRGTMHRDQTIIVPFAPFESHETTEMQTVESEPRVWHN